MPDIEGLAFDVRCSELHCLFSLPSPPPSIYFRFSNDVFD